MGGTEQSSLHTHDVKGSLPQNMNTLLLENFPLKVDSIAASLFVLNWLS